MALTPPGQRLIPGACAATFFLLLATLLAVAPFPRAYLELHAWEVALPLVAGFVAVRSWSERHRHPRRACVLAVGATLLALVAFLGQWQLRGDLDDLYRLHAAAQAACRSTAPLDEAQVFRAAGLPQWPTRFSFQCAHAGGGEQRPTTTRLSLGFDAYWELTEGGQLERR